MRACGSRLVAPRPLGCRAWGLVAPGGVKGQRPFQQRD